MLEILISSSILIVVLALLRAVLHGRIPARVQYALWGLVALRLLVPVSLFSLPVSASKVAAPIKRQIVTYSSERAVTVEYPVSMGREPVTGETVTAVSLNCADETLAESYRAFCVPTAFCSFTDVVHCTDSWTVEYDVAAELADTPDAQITITNQAGDELYIRSDTDSIYVRRADGSIDCYTGLDSPFMLESLWYWAAAMTAPLARRMVCWE